MALKPKYFGLIPAGGVGKRFGSAVPKQYARIQDKTLLEHSVQALLADSRIDKVFVVTSEDDDIAQELFNHVDSVEIIPKAGKERVNTVLNGLNHLLEQMKINETDWVLVHDAARPGLSSARLNDLIEQASVHVAGGLLALPVADTLKQAEVAEEGEVMSRVTVPREGLWAAQTPQMFRAQALSLALTECLFKGAVVTDEASAIEAMGISPLLIQGSPRNMKVTLASDLAVVQALMEAQLD